MPLPTVRTGFNQSGDNIAPGIDAGGWFYIFAIDASGTLWAVLQTNTAAYADWAALTSPMVVTAGVQTPVKFTAVVTALNKPASGTGAMQVIAVAADGTFWTCFSTSAPSSVTTATWSNWFPIGRPPGGTPPFRSLQVLSAQRSNGSRGIWLFCVDDGGKIYFSEQPMPQTVPEPGTEPQFVGWSRWTTYTPNGVDNPPPSVMSISAILDSNGANLQVFGLMPPSTQQPPPPQICWINQPPQTLVPAWTNLTAIQACYNTTNPTTIELIALDADGSKLWLAQGTLPPSFSWSSTSLPAPNNVALQSLTLATGQYLDVFCLGLQAGNSPTQQVWHIERQGQGNNGFGSWQNFSSPAGNPKLQTPRVGINGSGDLEVLTFGGDQFPWCLPYVGNGPLFGWGPWNMPLNPTAWMSSVNWSNKKLQQVALPGTHESGTAPIGMFSPGSPDAADSLTYGQTVGIGLGGGAVVGLAGGAILGANIGAIVGSIVPVIGTAIGALVGAAIGAVLGLIAGLITGPFVALSIFAGWARTQDQNIADQLMAGIRYFDLRVASRTDGQAWICHGRYAQPVSQVLKAVSDFVNNYPSEFVILDFNHLYNMGETVPGSSQTYNQLLFQQITETFGSLLIPAPGAPSDQFPVNGSSLITSLLDNNKRVAALYQDTPTVQGSGYQLWQSLAEASPPRPPVAGPAIYSFWPNVQNVPDLISSLSDPGLQMLGKAQGLSQMFVMQGVLTPNTSMILKGFLPGNPGSVEAAANSANKPVIDWLTQNKPVNYVAILDYFETTGTFVPTMMSFDGQ